MNECMNGWMEWNRMPLVPGRACVLNDALGAKAAEKYAAGHSGPPPPVAQQHTAAAPTTQGDGDGCGGSDKSFDMFD